MRKQQGDPELVVLTYGAEVEKGDVNESGIVKLGVFQPVLRMRQKTEDLLVFQKFAQARFVARIGVEVLNIGLGQGNGRSQVALSEKQKRKQ